MNLQINDNSFYEAQPTCGKPLLSAAAFHRTSFKALNLFCFKSFLAGLFIFS